MRKAFEFYARNDIGKLAVSVFLHSCAIKNLKTCCQDCRADRDLEEALLLFEVDCAFRAEFDADLTGAPSEVQAVLLVYDRCARDGLWKRPVDCLPFTHATFELARHAQRAFLFTLAATVAFLFVDVPWPLAYSHSEVPYISGEADDVAVS